MIFLIQRLAFRIRRSRTFAWAYLCQLILLNSMFLLFISNARADDCSIDPTRAEDCLRTPGFGENLGTGVAVIGTILVNGVAIQTIILQPRRPGDKDSDDPPITFFLNIKTQEARSTIKPDGKDSLWVYAKVSCSDPKVDCSAMTEGISFGPGGANADWLQTAQTDFQGGYKAVQIIAVNPNPAVPVPAPSACLNVYAAVQGGNLTATLPLQMPVQVAEWEVLLKPDGLTQVMPDTKESLTLYARIKFDETAFSDPAELQKVKDETKATIKMSSSTDWVKLDEPLQDTGDHVASWIIASNPSGNVGGTQGPELCTVTINGSFMGTPMATHTTVITLTARPEIDARPDQVQLLAGSRGSTDVTVWVSNPGPGTWSFDPRVTKGSAELLTLSKDDKGPAMTLVNIAENAGNLDTGASRIYCTVSVFAKNDDLKLELERQILVAVCQEGLVITHGADGDSIHVRADGKQVKNEVDLCVFTYSAETKELKADPEAARNIVIDIDEEAKSQGDNVASACVVHHDFEGITAENNPAAKIMWWAEKEIPGEDRMMVRYKASVPGMDPDKFSKQLPVTIEAMTLEEESEAKEIEIGRCREVIAKYIPADKQQQFYTLVDRRKDTLGPKGLATLRRKIWGIAVNLILADGAEGYKSEAEWANRIVVVLEWSEWAGDIAFNAAAAALCGPVGQIAAPMIKSAMVSAITCYENGEDFEAWAAQNLWGVWGVIEGQALDIDRLTRLTGNSKYKAWAIYIGYTFGKKLYQTRSLVEAAKETAQEIGMGQFNNWLGEKAKASYQKHGLGGVKPTPEGSTSAHPDEGDPSSGTHGDEPSTGKKPGEEPASTKKPGDETGTKPDESSTRKPGDETGAKPDESSTKKPGDETGTTPDEPGAKKPGDESGAKPDEPGTKKPGDDAPNQSGDENNPPPEPGEKPTRDEAWKQGREQGKQAIKELGEATKSDNPDRQRQAALRFLRDKNAMMELNNDPGAGYLRKKLNDTMQDVYTKTDRGTKTDLAQHLGVPETDIRVFNATNTKKPSGTTKSSYDRDITYQRRAKEGELVRDPNAEGGFHKVKAGEQRWVDIPASTAEKHYARNFYEASTGKQGASDAEVTSYARAHDQTCTDRLSADAYGTSRKDLDTAIKRPGRDFSDPQQVGQCMEHKSNEWFEKAHQVEGTHPSEAEGNRAEGMRQTTKQYDNQVKARVGALRDQGVDVKTNPRLESAMNEMKKVEKGQQSPAAAEAKLKELGYDSPQQVAHDSGKYLESLQKLRPKPPAVKG